METGKFVLCDKILLFQRRCLFFPKSNLRTDEGDAAVKAINRAMNSAKIFAIKANTLGTCIIFH